MVKIAPSLLSADFSRLSDEIAAVERGEADWIHLDVMDGHFVPNLTFGPIIATAVKKLTKLPMDVHLMISHPDAYLEAFRKAGADVLTVHYEACGHLWKTLDVIRDLGAMVGVTLNPATPVEMLKPVLERVDLILIMSVEPGFGGQQFIDVSAQRIAQLARWRKERQLDFLIEVDGGIDMTTIPLVVGAGADVLVAGNAVFSQPDISKAVRDLRSAAEV